MLHYKQDPDRCLGHRINKPLSGTLYIHQPQHDLDACNTACVISLMTYNEFLSRAGHEPNRVAPAAFHGVGSKKLLEPARRRTKIGYTRGHKHDRASFCLLLSGRPGYGLCRSRHLSALIASPGYGTGTKGVSRGAGAGFTKPVMLARLPLPKPRFFSLPEPTRLSLRRVAESENFPFHSRCFWVLTLGFRRGGALAPTSPGTRC